MIAAILILQLINSLSIAFIYFKGPKEKKYVFYKKDLKEFGARMNALIREGRIDTNEMFNKK